MFKKELVDVLKQTGWFAAALLIIPIPLMLLRWISGSYLVVFNSTLQPGLIFWSLFLGASLFGRERGQRAMEYALSFPHSRLGLLVRLAGPRLFVLSALFLLAWTASRMIGTGAGVLPYPALAVSFCLPLFLISLSLSVLVENFIALCLLVLAAWYAAGYVSFRLLWGSGGRFVHLRIPGAFAYPRPDSITFRSDFSFPLFLLQLVLPIIPFILALFLSFSRFDMRRSAGFIKRYIKAFAAGLILCALAAWLGAAAADSLANKYFHLTHDLKLVEWRYPSTTVRIHDGGSIRKIYARMDLTFPLWSDETFLYCQDIGGNLLRIDLSTGDKDILYPYSRKQRSVWNNWTHGKAIACLETGAHPNEIQLVLLEERTQQVSRLTFLHDAFNHGEPRLIGTDQRNGRRFWICVISGKSVKSTLRLWDNGQVEEILVKGRLETVNVPRFINGLLFFVGRESMFVLQDNGRSFEMKKEFPAGETFYVWDETLDRMSLDSSPVSYIFSKRKGPGRATLLARMNMSSLEIENIGEWTRDDQSWGYIFNRGGRAYYVGGSRSRKTLNIYDLNEGPIRLIRSFLDTDIQRRDSRLDIFETGIILVKGKHVGVYAFPDLREINFK
jgi:hypothetical protein